MKGLILSGGKGTRLYPLTYTRAKQLIPVANKPVLIRVIETLRAAGITEIGIVIGQTGPEIKEAVGNGHAWDVHITYIEQAHPEGLAHAVKISQDYIGTDPFVMFLGDNVIEGGISALIQDFTNHQWNSQIVLKAVANPTAFGVAALNSDGSIHYLVEKPPVPPSNLALVGIYMFDSNVFKAVNAIQPSKRGELEITDAIQWLVDNKFNVRAHIHEGWWIDTGKPIDMIDANCNVLDELVPFIAPNVTIENSQIDRRVSIANGAKIINSVIHGPTIIGENTVVENSYVGPYSSIYHHVRLVNSEVERSIILENCTIKDITTRLHGCLIGRNVELQNKDAKPRTLTMNLADNSTLWLV